MDRNKIAEFLSVLIAGVVIVGLVMLAFYYLKAAIQAVALVIIMVIAIGILQYLRKKFGRNQ